MFNIRNVVYIIVICCCFACETKKPPWVSEKRTHALVELGDEDSEHLCSLSNLPRLHAHLDNILIPRKIGSAGHSKVREYITRFLEGFGYAVSIHQFKAKTPRGRKVFSNIVALENPSSRRLLTLVCHYDSKDCHSKPGFCVPPHAGPFKFLGAIDSAFPCSVLLDVAETLSAFMPSRKNKDLGLQLIFLDGEEAFEAWTDTDSIYGARNLAEQWEKERIPGEDLAVHLDKIDVFVLLDLLGSIDTSVHMLGSLNHGSYMHFPKIEKRLDRSKCLDRLQPGFNTSLRIFNSERLEFGPGGGVGDDHVPFFQRGVPIVHLISIPFPWVWHREEDNRAVLVDDVMLKVASVVRVWVAEYLHLVIDKNKLDDTSPKGGESRKDDNCAKDGGCDSTGTGGGATDGGAKVKKTKGAHASNTEL